MKQFSKFGFLPAVLMSLSCTSRHLPQSELKSTKAQTEVYKVDANAFNAHAVWLGYDGGEAKLIRELPKDFWESASGKISHENDGILVTSAPKPTAGVKVDKDILIYPDKNPKGKSVELRVKFYTGREFKITPLGHVYAASHCTEQGRRLPTAQELLDFCTASAPQGESSRCYFGAIDDLWSVSISPEDSRSAWFWNGDDHRLYTDHRDPLGETQHEVICVGASTDK